MAAQKTAMWESALLCFTRAKKNGSWRDDDEPPLFGDDSEEEDA